MLSKLKLNKELTRAVIKITLMFALIFTMVSTMIGSVSAQKYVIVNDSGHIEVYCNSDSTENILNCAGITLKDNQKVERTENILSIVTYFTVLFKTYEEEIPVYTSVCTIDQAMETAGIANKEGYACSIPSGTVLTKDTTAVIAITKKSTVTKTETIPFKYIEKKTSTLYKGESKISKKGEDGSVEIVYEVTTVDGKEIKSVQISRTVKKEAVNGIKLIGTKAKPVSAKTVSAAAAKTSASSSTISVLKPSSAITLDANNRPLKYKSMKTVQATAYHQNIPSTSTGMTAKPGIVAVNPKIIPYYTKMWIVSTDGKYVYGYSIAADTGGFIKKRPTNVDLYFSSEAQCERFGRRNVNIYFL